ncbi:unnamed protein product [Anisakis simplex]|uniref:DUF148 domain-containing protein n=1 Tax=Anisakis simplex TaxID=6269 RepID=A0A0M3JLM3_ANISI|nr:unnamed protein product [Anisakis simplex]
MKILGEEKILKASQMVFVESLPDETKKKFMEISFDKGLTPQEQIIEYDKVAKTLSEKNQRFYENIKHQLLKRDADRAETIAKLDPKSRETIQKLEKIDQQVQQLFREAKNKKQVIESIKFISSLFTFPHFY